MDVDLRIYEHPILQFTRGKAVSFTFNNRRIRGYKGESIAAALLAAGIKVFRRSMKLGRARGFYCGIGKCSSCLMRVDGIPNVRTCIEPVREGMVVETQTWEPDLPTTVEFDVKREKIDVDIAVVGGGPAGLEAAITASKLGAAVAIIDENYKAGGQLIKQTHKFFGSVEAYAGVRGINIAKRLLSELRKAKVRWILGSSVFAHYAGSSESLLAYGGGCYYKIRAKKVIYSTGAMENMLLFPNNDLPGVYGAGGVQTIMNVYGVKPGNEALIVGAGNVGLILGYQLLQAGVRVRAVVEIMPKIGGYKVHANKLMRQGVPILTSHTIKEVHGKEWVESATIVEVDNNFNMIEGSEKRLDVDLVCIAVGLSPSIELPAQAGAKTSYIPELGGYVPIHDKFLKTSLENVYVAGDASGIEEATTAMFEGRIAGAQTSASLGYNVQKAETIVDNTMHQLEMFRKSPFSSRVVKGKMKVFSMMGDLA
ncbi:MAG TPA: FAD-dependent oxidoreductase [Candidatus Bathyarchaeota archaeon]|nr:FAD-dependent oxidoreductase [Candidatus Bathyarchaeota archaeon]